MATGSPRQEGRNVHYERCGGLTCPCYYDGYQEAMMDAGLVRDILVALAERDGVSLDSEADPGTSARNYELALRLRIGHVFGLEQT